VVYCINTWWHFSVQQRYKEEIKRNSRCGCLNHLRKSALTKIRPSQMILFHIMRLFYLNPISYMYFVHFYDILLLYTLNLPVSDRLFHIFWHAIFERLFHIYMCMEYIYIYKVRKTNKNCSLRFFVINWFV